MGSTSTADNTALSQGQGLPCLVCKSVPVRRGSIPCQKCGRLYHSKCADRATKVEDGTTIFAKCCGPVASSVSSDLGDSADKFNMNELKELLSSHQAKMSADFATVKSSVDGLRDTVESLSKRLDSFDQRLLEQSDSIEAVRIRVATIEETIEDINSRSDTSKEDILAFCLAEVEERESRRNNLMLFGMTETLDSDPSTMKNRDLDKIANFVKTIYPSCGGFRSFRIGRFSQASTSPRPVKLVFDITEQAQIFLRIFLQVKKEKKLATPWTDIIVTPDRTQNQIKHYKDLEREMRDRREKGESHLKIVHQNMVPKLVKVKSRV